MVDLVAKSAFEGLLPIHFGKMHLTAADLVSMTLIQPFKGQTNAISDILQTAHKIKMPKTGQFVFGAHAKALWFGRGQIMLVGPPATSKLSDYAAVSDQSDGWVGLEFRGQGAADVLARLVPIDMRADHFPLGSTARSLVGHMQASISCIGPDHFLIFVFRSMAGTLVHDLSEGAETVLALM